MLINMTVIVAVVAVLSDTPMNPVKREAALAGAPFELMSPAFKTS
ncbi:MAG: hypothetical protein WKF75_20510 [Singulisphaera sp.]